MDCGVGRLKRSGAIPPREAGAVTVDYACKTSADCAVKNVGNCCGAMPACVNKNSPTDPQGVRAQCAASGMAIAVPTPTPRIAA